MTTEDDTLDRTGDRALFTRCLMEYNEYPERRSEIVTRIEERFQRTIGIMVIDSFGFTRIVHKTGIIPFLANLERIARLIIPCVRRHGGKLLKREADNLFAVFPDATLALKAAIESCQHVEIANEPLPVSSEMHISIGLGYGEVLMVGDQDVFGDEMNLTCKLGEDLAKRNEILLTTTAHANLTDPPCQFEQLTFTVSGLALDAFRALHDSTGSQRG
jgi:class 3 adenylate cyclase